MAKRKGKSKRKGKRYVHSHKRIRKSCKWCGRAHSANRCRFHGHGSYKRTHG